MIVEKLFASSDGGNSAKEVVTEGNAWDVLTGLFKRAASQLLFPAPSPPLGFRHPSEGLHAVSHSIFPDQGNPSHFGPLTSTVFLLKRTGNQKSPENHS